MNLVSDCVASFSCVLFILIKILTLFHDFFELANHLTTLPCCTDEPESEDNGDFLEMDMVIEEE